MKVGDKVMYIKHEYSGDSEFFTIGDVYTITETYQDTHFYLNHIKLHVHSSQIVKVIPNNELSRIIYPSMIQSKCGKYLIDEKK